MTLFEFKQHEVLNNIPVVRDETEKLLIEKLKEHSPKNVLEIGTATGYSGVVILKNSNASLTTIEINPERFNIAKENFEKFNVSDRANQILGDAKDFIEQSTQKFDFIFLDGAKGQYKNYLISLKKLLNKNGVLFCDNVLFRGMVKSNAEPPKKYRTIVKNLREFLNALTLDADFLTSIFEIEDGVSVSVLK